MVSFFCITDHGIIDVVYVKIVAIIDSGKLIIVGSVGRIDLDFLGTLNDNVIIIPKVYEVIKVSYVDITLRIVVNGDDV